MMYLIAISTIIKLQLSIFIAITEATNIDLVKCETILDNPYSLQNNLQNNKDEYKEIARTLFDAVLEKMNFPFKIFHKSKSNQMIEYVIDLADMDASKYIEGLENNIDISKYAASKEKSLLRLHKEISNHTKLLFQTLLCINFKMGKLKLLTVKNILDKHVRKTFDAKNSYFNQIFSEDAQKRIIDDLYATIGPQNQFVDEKRKMDDSMMDKFVNTGEDNNDEETSNNNDSKHINNEKDRSYTEETNDNKMEENNNHNTTAKEDISDVDKPDNDDNKQMNDDIEKEIRHEEEGNYNNSGECNNKNLTEKDISSKKLNMNTQENNNNMMDNTNITNEDHMDKKEEERISRIEKHLNMHRNGSYNMIDDTNNSAITFYSNSCPMLVASLASLLATHQLGNDYLLN
ncbi:putative SP-containing protein [Vairimorpha necatrix]|uniref:SP-containing protein n=1 Tax=Vairimorpha necatrix TaxID=6039 RepID=A0AAX4JIM2_9MICR